MYELINKIKYIKQNKNIKKLKNRYKLENTKIKTLKLIKT